VRWRERARSAPRSPRSRAGSWRGSAVDSLVGIDAIVRIVKVVGFVASAQGFGGQPGVINGASLLLGDVFGESGAHARSAVGVSELPLNAPVEVELIVEVK
jgi:enamine deaminase RidA (YjgF/YER057c/UK114 family)